jgi:hypothetical protein
MARTEERGSCRGYEYDIDGEQLGAFGWVPLLAGLPARNTRLAHFDIVDIVEVVGGKIGRVWRYDNPVEVLGGSAATVAGDAGKQ